MKTLRGFLSRAILLSTAVVLLAFLALFAFFDLIAELRDVGRVGYRLGSAFLYVALSIPGHIYELFPIAVLIGTLYVLADLAARSEYTVMRTSGMSAFAAARSLVPVGLVLVLACALLGELVTPFAESAAQRVRLGAMGGSIMGQELRSGVWVKADSRVINIGQVRTDSSIGKVRMYDFDSNYRLRTISDAGQGTYAGENVWRLTEVIETRFTEEGAEVVKVPEVHWKTVLTPELLRVLTIDPQKMSAYDLIRYTSYLKRNNQRGQRYEIALWHKLVYPFASLVMIALALPFAYLQTRAGSIGVKMFLGVLIGVVFHGMNTLASHLGVLQSWPPVLSALLPSALFLAVAVTALWWVERR
jgi:lipopolysaccharide export system permease protein